MQICDIEVRKRYRIISLKRKEKFKEKSIFHQERGIPCFQMFRLVGFLILFQKIINSSSEKKFVFNLVIDRESNVYIEICTREKAGIRNYSAKLKLINQTSYQPEATNGVYERRTSMYTFHPVVCIIYRLIYRFSFAHNKLQANGRKCVKAISQYIYTYIYILPGTVRQFIEIY